MGRSIAVRVCPDVVADAVVAGVNPLPHPSSRWWWWFRWSCVILLLQTQPRDNSGGLPNASSRCNGSRSLVVVRRRNGG